MTYEGKLVLLSTCIASIPMYLMSIIKFPKWAIKAITSQMSHFFWGNFGESHKYHLANWGVISRHKEFGGMGVPNLRDVNIALLGSWDKKYFSGGNKNWRILLDHKYRTNKPNILWPNSNDGSPFWKRLTWALSATRRFYRWKV